MAINYNIDICGKSGCGKSAFMRRHYSYNYYKEIIPLENVVLKFNTNYGRFNLFVREGESKEANARLIFFDASEDIDVKNIEQLLDCNIPKVLCETKIDKIRIVDDNNEDVINVERNELIYNLIKKFNVKIYPISSKMCYNFEKPFQQILRLLTEKEDLHFIA